MLLCYAYDIVLVIKRTCAVFQGLKTAEASYMHSELQWFLNKEVKKRTAKIISLPISTKSVLLYSTEEVYFLNLKNYRVTPGSLGPHYHIHKSHIVSFTIVWTQNLFLKISLARGWDGIKLISSAVVSHIIVWLQRSGKLSASTTCHILGDLGGVFPRFIRKHEKQSARFPIQKLYPSAL